PRDGASLRGAASLGRATGASADTLRLLRISYADSRFTRVSYLAPIGLLERTVARSSAVIEPIRQRGGQMIVRSTGIGTPLSCSIDTSASPTASSAMTLATLSLGLATNVSAAVGTAFWSRGVKGRSACWTRCPSWPRISFGTSSGNWEQKYTPTPLDRMIRTTCSTRWRKDAGASSNKRGAPPKKNTSLAFSRSPTSGSLPKTSARAQRRKLE